jgi:glycosyltransferase involved in cell wall biosynthesis
MYSYDTEKNMNLFEIGEEQKLQKTVRVLWYPNITFQKDLEKDSYIQVAKNQIKLLNEIRDDLWHYMILPCPVPSLQFDNVTQWYIDFETYPQTMRSNFRVDVVRKMLNNSLDFDLVMSHLPEHTHQLVNTLYNVTHHKPAVTGYSHWFDLKDVVAWPKDSFLQNLTGLLEYDRCMINTQHQKDLVLNQASDHFNSKTIKQLDKILTVQHLGVDAKDIIDNINETPEKIIVFNHRPDTYKHFKEFIAVCDKLWELRQDFKVWVPLLDKPNREYVVTTKGDKKWYYKELQKCYMGFSPKQTYGGWSVSTTDGMMNGVPYIMYDAGYYHELNPKGEFFKDDHEALMLMNTYLDDPQFRNEEATKALDCIYESLIYKDKMVEMNEYMNDLLSRQKVMGDSDKFKEIVEFIKTNKEVRKIDLMDWLCWGRGIKWTPYRRALMNHPNIYDVNGSNPIYCWKD